MQFITQNWDLKLFRDWIDYTIIYKYDDVMGVFGQERIRFSAANDPQIYSQFRSDYLNYRDSYRFYLLQQLIQKEIDKEFIDRMTQLVQQYETN